MPILAHQPSTVLAPGPIDTKRRAAAPVGLRLTPTQTGWSLVGLDGGAVFSAPGTEGRRRCLAYARAHGVLAVFS